MCLSAKWAKKLTCRPAHSPNWKVTIGASTTAACANYRAIDWKATARRQKLITRECQQERNQSVVWCGGVVPEFSRNVRLAASPKAPDRSGGCFQRLLGGSGFPWRGACFSSCSLQLWRNRPRDCSSAGPCAPWAWGPARRIPPRRIGMDRRTKARLSVGPLAQASPVEVEEINPWVALARGA